MIIKKIIHYVYKGKLATHNNDFPSMNKRPKCCNQNEIYIIKGKDNSTVLLIRSDGGREGRGKG